MKVQKKNSGIVYSTEFGEMCPKCKKAQAACVCKATQLILPNDGIVRLMRQTKGRKGKGVTLITGLPMENADLKKLAKTLKQKCGSGGSVKNGVIEIQGDHRDVLEKILSELDHKVKRAG